MNTLLFDFTIDKPSKKVFITREFAAPVNLVWDAFTKQEILDQWWAPKPWQSRTKYMQFEEGGKRLYAMVGPEGQESWSIQEFSAINPVSSFKMFNAFSDAAGNPDLPGSHWDFNFSETEGITKLQIVITNDSLERMEKLIAMGFQGGFTMTLDYLDQMLKTL
jgi:uncharacterized protein YndB with AHSA1/START domain